MCAKLGVTGDPCNIKPTRQPILFILTSPGTNFRQLSKPPNALPVTRKRFIQSDLCFGTNNFLSASYIGEQYTWSRNARTSRSSRYPSRSRLRGSFAGVFCTVEEPIRRFFCSSHTWWRRGCSGPRTACWLWYHTCGVLVW